MVRRVRNVSIKDVAATAGVSPGTVSNALNRPDVVAPETRRRVLDAIESIGYIPNEAARRMRALENRAIGILLFDVIHPYENRVAKGVQAAAEELGYTTLLCDSNGELDRVKHHLQFLSGQRVAGLVAFGSSLPRVAERFEDLRRRGILVVKTDVHTSLPNECSVTVDDAAGGRLVAQHLIEIGCRRLCFVNPEMAFLAESFQAFADRPRGAQEVVDERDDCSLTILSTPQTEHTEVAEAIRDGGYDGVFCLNDVVAACVLRELTRLGVRVPDDVALVGYDNSELAEYGIIPLTSVNQPSHLVGRTAAQLLIDEHENPDHAHQHITYQPELIVRASTSGST